MTLPICCSLPMKERETLTHGLCHVCSLCGRFTCPKMRLEMERMGMEAPDMFPAFLLPEAAIYLRPSPN